ncbi:MAG: hypothetical protein ACYC5J_14935 [Chloroflexota bacterium]
MATNEQGSVLGAPVVKSYLLPTDGWQSFRPELAAPSNAAKFRVQLKVDSLRGVAHVDGLSLVAV